MLIPKKSTVITKKVSEEMNLSNKMVNDITDFYWKEVRKSLSCMDHISVLVYNFGRFDVRKFMLKHQISNISIGMERYSPITFRRAIIFKEMEEQVNKMKIMQEELAKESIRKQLVKDKRYGKEPERGI